MTTCEVCGQPFRVKRNHPGIENDHWCPECLPAVRLRVTEQLLNVPPGRAIRAEDI